MKAWNLLSLKEKTMYCCLHRLTLREGESKYLNEYKQFKFKEHESIR